MEKIKKREERRETKDASSSRRKLSLSGTSTTTVTTPAASRSMEALDWETLVFFESSPRHVVPVFLKCGGDDGVLVGSRSI